MKARAWEPDTRNAWEKPDCESHTKMNLSSHTVRPSYTIPSEPGHDPVHGFGPAVLVAPRRLRGRVACIAQRFDQDFLATKWFGNIAPCSRQPPFQAVKYPVSSRQHHN